MNKRRKNILVKLFFLVYVCERVRKRRARKRGGENRKRKKRDLGEKLERDNSLTHL